MLFLPMGNRLCSQGVASVNMFGLRKFYSLEAIPQQELNLAGSYE